MKRQQMQPGLIVQENKEKSDFIGKFMGAEGQMPGNPWNAALPVPSRFAAKDDPIANGFTRRTIPYGDRDYIDTSREIQYVRPLAPSARIMVPDVPGSDVPGATADASFDPGTRMMPASDLTSRIDAAMFQNAPPPQNVQPMVVSPEARGMSTSVASPGAGPQRNVPPPKAT